MKDKEISLSMNLSIVNHNGIPALEFRRIISLCDKNLPFFKKVIEASFSDKELIAPIKIEFNDKIRAAQKLKELGLIKEDIAISLIEKKEVKGV